MKKKNLIAALAMIALSATSVMALELDADATKEIAQEVQANVEQTVNAQAKDLPELPDYKSLNQTMINILQEQINKLEEWEKRNVDQYIKEKEEEHGMPYILGGVEQFDLDITPALRTNRDPDNALVAYKNLLTILKTKKRYTDKDRKEINNLINELAFRVGILYERSKSVNFLCKQDRYYLKAEDSIVNLAFLFDEKAFNSYGIIDGFLLNCIKEQEPIQIKVHSFRRAVSNFLHSSEGQEVLDGFQNEANAGK